MTPPPIDAPDGPRIHLLAVDGASLDYISPAAAEGRLPYFGRLLDAGASMHLTTVRPTQAATVWSSVATGKHPARTGVRSAVDYHVPGGLVPLRVLPDHALAQGLVRLGFLDETPVTAAALRARPFWDILSARGISVGVVDWPLTFPVAPVHGFAVSDRFYATVARPFVDDRPVVYPPDLLPLARRAGAAALLAISDDVLPAARTPATGGRADVPPLPRDRVNARVAADLTRQVDPRVSVRRYHGVDVSGHRFLRYARPEAFGDVSEDELRQYGQVLDWHYRALDAEIGLALDRLGEDDLLLVVSGYGMEPVRPWHRLLARVLGDAEQSGTHERGPDGFLLAFGSRVVPGRLPVGSIVDVLPTLLYYLGLPVARDLDGYARTDLFRPAFTDTRPITFIPTYER